MYGLGELDHAILIRPLWGTSSEQRDRATLESRNAIRWFKTNLRAECSALCLRMGFRVNSAYFLSYLFPKRTSTSEEVEKMGHHSRESRHTISGTGR